MCTNAYKQISERTGKEMIFCKLLGNEGLLSQICICQRFCQENLTARDINYGMIAHGNDKGRNMAIHDVIARLCYCHRAELSMHMHGRTGW